MSARDPKGTNIKRCEACKGSGRRKGYRGPCAFCAGSGYHLSEGQSVRDMMAELRSLWEPIRQRFMFRGWPVNDELLVLAVRAAGLVKHGNGATRVPVPAGAISLSSEWGKLALALTPTAQMIVDELQIAAVI